jgi:hypothetical protein
MCVPVRQNRSNVMIQCCKMSSATAVLPNVAEGAEELRPYVAFHAALLASYQHFVLELATKVGISLRDTSCRDCFLFNM